MTTPNLGLSELIASQTQPHIPINTSLRRLDGLAQLSVLDRALNTPPGSPAEGDTYIVGASPTGAWAAYSEGDVALYTSAGWTQIEPVVGWLAFVQNESLFYFFDNTASPPAWSELETGGGGGAALPMERKVYKVIEELISPPGSPSNGDAYVIGRFAGTPTGAWSAMGKGALVWRNGTTSSWEEIVPGLGELVYVSSLDQWWYCSNASTDPIQWRPVGPATVVSLFKSAAPTTSEVLLAYVATQSLLLIPEDFAGSYGSVGVNPAASFTIDVQLDSSSIGSIVISTGGAFTFTCSATGVGPGSVLELIAPSGTDASIRRIAISLSLPLNTPAIF